MSAIRCPACRAPFYCEVDPPDRSVGIMGPTIVSVWALSEDGRAVDPCSHIQEWFDSTLEEGCTTNRAMRQFEEEVYEQID